MSNYRIKIIERNNGICSFIPQFDDKNIIRIHMTNTANGVLILCDKREHHCQTEKEALLIINEYKEQERERIGNEIKSTTFKDIL
jgi:hypothetical protein